MIEYFRIVEIKNDQYLTLFHAMPDEGRRSRRLPVNEWLTAEESLSATAKAALRCSPAST